MVDQTKFMDSFHKIGGGIGILSSIFVIFLFWFFKEIRLFQYEVIMVLCLFRMIIDSVIFLPFENKDDILCKIKGYIVVIFQKFSWCCITYLSYLSFIFGVKKKFIDNHKNLLRLSIFLISLIICGSFGTFLFNLDAIGKINDECYIKSNEGYAISIFYDLFFILINLYLFIRIHYLLCKLKKIGKGKELKQIYCVIQIFPLLKSINVIILIIKLINPPKNNEFYYKIFIYFFSTFFTLMLSILYIFLPHVKISIGGFFEKLCSGKTDVELISQVDISNLNDSLNL